MELKVTNKRLDTRPIGRRLTQGESLVDRPRIVLQKTYEGLDISGYSYEIRAVSDKDTLVRRPLDKTVEGDKLILLWTVTAEFTSVSGPLALTIVVWTRPETRSCERTRRAPGLRRRRMS